MADEELALDHEQETGAHDHDHEQEHDHEDEGEVSAQEEMMRKLKDAILVEREEVGPLRLKLTITVPRETIDERMGEQFAELRKDAIIPGFRKGKAPMHLVEKRFGHDVGDQLKSQLVGSGYMAAIDKVGIKPLGDPRLWVKVKEERTGDDGKPRAVETEKLLSVEKALETIELPKDKALSFACEVELKPEFELPELANIPVKRPNVKVADSDVDEEIRRMRMSFGRYEPVEDGAIQPHDLLYGEMKLTVDDQVVASDENFEVFARDGVASGFVLGGWGEAVVGKRLGDQVSSDAKAPDDHANIEVRGKPGRFNFTVREIKRLSLPPLDQELLSSMGYESEEDMRTTLRDSMEYNVDLVIRRAMREQVADYLIEHTDFIIPEGMSQRQTERLVLKRMIDMLQAGVPEAEVTKMADELRTKAREHAVRDGKLFFILQKIAEERNIDVGEDEINAAISNIAQRTNKRFDRVRDELSRGDGLLSLYVSLRDAKILDELLEEAAVSETQGPETSIAGT